MPSQLPLQDFAKAYDAITRGAWESEWQGNIWIELSGEGISDWLKEHSVDKEGHLVTRNWGDLGLMSADYSWTACSINFKWIGKELVRDSVHALLLATSALARLPGQEFLRRCRVSINADTYPKPIGLMGGGVSG